jgi:hypothetical protein
LRTIANAFKKGEGMEREKILKKLAAMDADSLDRLRNDTYQKQYYNDLELHKELDAKLELKMNLNELKFKKRRYFIKELDFSPNKAEQMLKSDPDIHEAKQKLLKQEKKLNQIKEEVDRLDVTEKIIERYYWRARV